MTDGELLGAFVEQHDEAAFEALVRRHGAMVLGVCRRILGDVHDAEDAFQASFLVLARRAAAISQRELVGNWLYGVASRTALELKSRTARRRSREKQVMDMPHPTVEPAAVWDDVQPLLDQELSRLPDKYRIPIVLCDLEGRSRKEAAGTLCIPEGTLSSRLTTGRKMLAKKLTRHGVMLSAGILATLLAQKAAAGTVAPALVAATVKAATAVAAGGAIAGVSAQVLALVEAVLHGLLTTKTAKTLTLCLAAALFGLLAGPPKPAPAPRVDPATACCEPSRPEAPPSGGNPPTGRNGTWMALGVDQNQVCHCPQAVLAFRVQEVRGVVHVLAAYGGDPRLLNQEEGELLCVFSVAWVPDCQGQSVGPPQWRLSGGATLGPLAWGSWADLWRRVSRPDSNLTRLPASLERKPAAALREAGWGGGSFSRFAAP
jgi:RNA polymerase sigma factor (sigma-70 family)